MTSAFITLGATTAASVLPEGQGGLGEWPSAKLLIGTAFTFTGLSMFSDFAPAPAAGLAGSIALTAMMFYGIPLLDNWFNGAHHKVQHTSTDRKPTPKKKGNK